MLVFLGGYALYPVRGTIFNYVGGYTVFGRALWNHIYMNPNDLAALTLLMLGLALAFYVREPKGWPRLAAIAGLFLLPVVILLTQSRGTLIALGIVMLIVLAGHRKQLLRTLLVLSAVGIVGYLFAPAAVWERLGGLRGVTDTERLEEVDSSAEQRYEIWKVARTVFADHPVMGVGAGAYPATHLQYTRTGNFKPTAFGAKDAHSTYLTLLAENGVVGLLLFLGIFGATIRWADRVRRRARAVLPRSAQQLFYMELGLIGFFLAGVFASYAHLAFAYVHLALLWCVARSTEEELQALDGTAAFGQRAHV
jgi:O-antigen ligase